MGRRLPSLTFTAIAALAVGAGAIVDRQTRGREAALFAEAEKELVTAIEDRLDHYVDGLRATAGLFKASERVEPAEFRNFAAALRLHARFPGVRGIGFARVVGRDPLRTEVVYIEPLDRNNRAALGFDMYSEPARRAAMRESVESAEPTATDRVTLVQPLGAEGQRGFLIYVPVYASGARALSSAERWAAIQGFVFAPFRADDFFASIGRGVLSFSVDDASPPRRETPLYHFRAPESAALTGERLLAVRGRTWVVRTGSDGLLSPLERRLGWLLMGLGLLVAWGFYRFGLVVVRRSEALERAQDELRLITDSLPVLIAYVDKDLRYRFVNKTYETWYGRPKASFLGTPVGAHLGEDRARRIRSWMERVLEGEPVSYVDEIPTVEGPRHVEALGIPDRGAGGVRGLFIVVSDVTAQRQSALELERRVAERTQELSSALRELETFSYTVSHDLRAPLRSIQSFSTLLLRSAGPRLEPGERDYLDRVVAAGQRMSALIADILELSQISRYELKSGPVDLARLARETAEQVAAAWHHKVAFTAPAALPAVGDERLLRIVMENLLENAWKYTSRTPDARVEFAFEDGAYVVRDNGAGFEAAHAPELFKPFKRLHTRDQFEGTGIGLATVERIIARHGGRVSADGAPGKGAAFRFTLGRGS